jgi:hypothetical protein
MIASCDKSNGGSIINQSMRPFMNSSKNCLADHQLLGNSKVNLENHP